MSICAFNMQTTPRYKRLFGGRGQFSNFRSSKWILTAKRRGAFHIFCSLLFSLLYFFGFLFLLDAHKISAKLNYKYGQKVDDKVARRQRIRGRGFHYDSWPCLDYCSPHPHPHPNPHPLPALVKACQRMSLAFGQSACQIGEASHSILWQVCIVFGSDILDVVLEHICRSGFVYFVGWFG